MHFRVEFKCFVSVQTIVLLTPTHRRTQTQKHTLKILGSYGNVSGEKEVEFGENSKEISGSESPVFIPNLFVSATFLRCLEFIICTCLMRQHDMFFYTNLPRATWTIAWSVHHGYTAASSLSIFQPIFDMELSWEHKQGLGLALCSTEANRKKSDPKPEIQRLALKGGYLERG